MHEGFLIMLIDVATDYYLWTVLASWGGIDLYWWLRK